MGLAMRELRGKVPALEVARRRHRRGSPRDEHAQRDALKGYKGHARAALERWGVRVWSDVRVVNDAGSVFEGVILPRSRDRSTTCTSSSS